MPTLTKTTLRQLEARRIAIKDWSAYVYQKIPLQDGSFLLPPDRDGVIRYEYINGQRWPRTPQDPGYETIRGMFPGYLAPRQMREALKARCYAWDFKAHNITMWAEQPLLFTMPEPIGGIVDEETLIDFLVHFICSGDDGKLRARVLAWIDSIPPMRRAQPSSV